MGKGTDKLYITHSEWSTPSGGYSASSSASSHPKSSSSRGALPFTRLPFSFCSLSLQPFKTAVCTPTGQIFDPTHILPYLSSHNDVNPLDRTPLPPSSLFPLLFVKNCADEYIDPVTHKVFTDNTHLVAIRTTGNVFAYDTVERLNIKAKHWRDLVSEESFSRDDLVVLQDPRSGAGGGREVRGFEFLKETGGKGLKAGGDDEEGRKGVNLGALGSAAKVLRAKEVVEEARRVRSDPNRTVAVRKAGTETDRGGSNIGGLGVDKGRRAGYAGYKIPYNAAQHTTGKAAASFTSTGLTPHTGGERALLSDEEYLLRPRRVKGKGYARIVTSQGGINIELETEWAPRAVWNFMHLAKNGYYKGVTFHRNIKNFMIQGGDPTGTGKGGQSVWNKPFNDEFDGPLTHDARGMLSMANKGKNSNTSQFFITYRPAKHLDRKHTIFGRCVGGLDALDRLEGVPVGEGDRPIDPITIEEVNIFVDPFEEFLKERQQKEDQTKAAEDLKRQGGADDEKMTWTGKRIRKDGTIEQSEGSSGVGKYLKAAKEQKPPEDEIIGDWEGDNPVEPVRKKVKATGGGFGNFDGW